MKWPNEIPGNAERQLQKSSRSDELPRSKTKAKRKKLFAALPPAMLLIGGG